MEIRGGTLFPWTGARMGRSRGQGSLLGVTLCSGAKGKAGHIGTPAVVSVDFPPFYSTPSCLEIMCLVESPKKVSGYWEI